MPSPTPAPPSGKTTFGHPSGVLLVAGTEMWERFSYYGLAVLLVLFLTAPVVSGGFGWDNADAVRVYGLYSGIAFSAPAIGGWIASRYLGERRSIVIGGLVIVLGHFLLGAPGYGPWLVEAACGIPADDIITGSGVYIGHIIIPDDVIFQLSQTAENMGYKLTAGSAFGLNLAYLAKGWGLLLGLGFIIIGTGFIKGPISSIVGKLYRRDDERREMGFTVFMVGVWLGSLAAELIVGVIGEHVSWHMGLATAGIGMACGLTVYLLRQQALLGDVGKAVTVNKQQPGFYLSPDERRKIYALALMAVFTVIFSIAYSQYGGVWNLVIYNNVDRQIGTFTVPASWYITTTTLGFIILAPLAPTLYRWLSKLGYDLDVVHKQALGLFSIAAGYALLWVLANQHAANPDAMLSGGWVLCAYVFFAIGDIFIWPPQINAVSSLAPERYQSFMIGLWYVTYGLGGIIGGYVGPMAYSWGLPFFSGAILLLCVCGGAVLLLLRPIIQKLTSHKQG